MPGFTLSSFGSSDKSVLAKYLHLTQGDQVQCMYVWIDGTGEFVRAKTKTVNFEPKAPKGTLAINI